MKLSDRERIAVVRHKRQRAKETLIEAQGSIELKYRHVAANRLYYAAKEQYRFYRRVPELRQAGDYDDRLDLTADDILPLPVPAQHFIETIEELVNETQ
jgi:uncharacterized protein (UPF0332 family)